MTLMKQPFNNPWCLEIVDMSSSTPLFTSIKIYNKVNSKYQNIMPMQVSIENSTLLTGEIDSSVGKNTCAQARETKFYTQHSYKKPDTTTHLSITP